MGGWDSFTKSVSNTTTSAANTVASGTTSTANSAGNALSSTANTVGSGITGSSDSTVNQSVGGATLGVLTLAPVTATAALTPTTTPYTGLDENGNPYRFSDFLGSEDIYGGRDTFEGIPNPTPTITNTSSTITNTTGDSDDPINNYLFTPSNTSDITNTTSNITNTTSKITNTSETDITDVTDITDESGWLEYVGGDDDVNPGDSGVASVEQTTDPGSGQKSGLNEGDDG